MARIRLGRTEFVGRGCGLQGLALLMPIVGGCFGWTGFNVGLVLAAILFIVGMFQANTYVCSECGSRLDGTYIKRCPGCGDSFTER